jgi:hypothetical protein
MSAKIKYIKEELSSLKAQLAADDKAELRKKVALAEAKVKARELLGQEPDRAEAEAVAGLIDGELTKANGKKIAAKSVPDFLKGFDAAVDPEE